VSFLDAQAKELLAEARENFNRFDWLIQVIAQGRTTISSAGIGTGLWILLRPCSAQKGLKAANEGIAIVITNASPDDVQKCLRVLLKRGLPDAYKLARSVINKAIEKYDLFLTDELLSAD